MDHYRKFSELLLRSRHAVALTGAGISVESGIPDFRSKDGLWSKYDPAEYGYIESFRVNPAKVWKMLLEVGDLISSVAPNEAHLALAELEQLGILKAVVTQNVDSLHQRAGNRNVVEFHGSFRVLRCDRCSRLIPREEVSLENLPPLCARCSGPLRPDIVFFGEDIPRRAYSAAMQAAHACDLMLVIGTSATVAPASHLPLIAKERGAVLLEVNPCASQLSHFHTDLHVAEPAGRAMKAILSAVKGSGLTIEETDRCS